jgi:hypothetical protein
MSEPSIVQPIASHYTDYATVATQSNKSFEKSGLSYLHVSLKFEY